MGWSTYFEYRVREKGRFDLRIRMRRTRRAFFFFFFWLKTFFKIARERRCEEEKGFDLGMELDDEELGLSFSWLFKYVRIPQKLA